MDAYKDYHPTKHGNRSVLCSQQIVSTKVYRLTISVYWCIRLKSFLQNVWTNTLLFCSQTSFGLVEYSPSNQHVKPRTDCPQVRWLQVSTCLMRNCKVVSPQQKELCWLKSTLAEVSFKSPCYWAASLDFLQTLQYCLALFPINNLLQQRY